MRTKYLDPDFRRTPKTNRWCCVCQRDLDPSKPNRLVLTINDGTDAVYPADSTLATNGVLMEIGSDCAKRFGLEWTISPPTEN
jgi:hypothetical protein